MEVFLIQFLQRYSWNGSIRIVSLESWISNQWADIFFKFSQITNDVALIEHETLLIAHLLSHWQEETTLLESVNHLGNVRLDLSERLLCLFCFFLTINNWLNMKKFTFLWSQHLNVQFLIPMPIADCLFPSLITVLSPWFFGFAVLSLCLILPEHQSQC